MMKKFALIAAAIAVACFSIAPAVAASPDAAPFLPDAEMNVASNSLATAPAAPDAEMNIVPGTMLTLPAASPPRRGG